jgi:signal transduction histidine kinase
MSLFKSIRWRLQLWHGLILVTVLIGFGLTAYHLARSNQFRRVDQDLRQRVSTLQPVLRQRGPGGMPRGREGFPPPPPFEEDGFRPPRGGEEGADPPQVHLRPEQERLFEGSDFYYVIWWRDGRVVTRSTNAPSDIAMPARLAGHADAVRMRGVFREQFLYTPPGECVLAGRSVAPELRDVRRMGFWLGGAGAGVLIGGLAGGWWLATRAIRPIDAISATASRIAAGDLAQRINTDDSESELGQLTSVLNTTFARLEAAFAQQGRFTADASHELRTPVSVILSQTQMALSRERTAPEYRETLEACQRAAQRMRRLTESLLELAKLDAGEEAMKREQFDLARVARESAELLRPLAAESKVKLECDVASMQCVGDSERIGQVVTNLISNAIHYNREQGEVRLSSSAVNGSVTLAVSDTGQGIPAEDVPHIFERFYRVDKSRSRASGRTGLGLAICKAIVDAHGGRLEVWSELGKGSTFTLTLPAKV